MKNLILFIIAIIWTSFTTFSQEKMEVAGAIVVQNTTNLTPVPGTIRWTGMDFEGWNGLAWVSLTGHAITGTVTDIDGNVYPTIRIGNQIWMAANLRVTRYKDGTSIGEVTNGATWQGLVIGAWCWYSNNNIYELIFGKLYNWFALNDPKGLCPANWHTPSDAEWTILSDFLGGLAISGGKLKEPGSAHWTSVNIGATNESAFTALPGGFRTDTGNFGDLNNRGNWWTNQEATVNNGFFRKLDFSTIAMVSGSADKNYGYSVRCVKN